MLTENRPIVIILENNESVFKKIIFRGNGDPFFSYNELLTLKKYIDSTIDMYIDNQYTDETIHRLNEVSFYKPQGEKFNKIQEEKISILNEKQINYIYLMLDERSKYHKIGISKNPNYRERTLQSENPNVILKKKWEGEKSDEIHLHKLFDNKRIRGEWFNLDESDLIIIENFFQSK